MYAYTPRQLSYIEAQCSKTILFSRAFTCIAIPQAKMIARTGKREYPDPNRPVPAERVSQPELEREEHFKQVRLRQV